jgi:hypothetical protein
VSSFTLPPDGDGLAFRRRRFPPDFLSISNPPVSGFTLPPDGDGLAFRRRRSPPDFLLLAAFLTCVLGEVGAALTTLSESITVFKVRGVKTVKNKIIDKTFLRFFNI